MKKIIKTENAPKPIGPYNQAVIAGNYMFISGQIALNPKNGELITSEIKEETSQVMENLKAILSEASLTFENVVKTTIFLFKKQAEVYQKLMDLLQEKSKNGLVTSSNTISAAFAF